jgi:hypothetical protein
MQSCTEISKGRIDRIWAGIVHIKGTRSQDFRPTIFSSKHSIWALIPRDKAFLHMASYLQIYNEVDIFGGHSGNYTADHKSDPYEEFKGRCIDGDK